MVYETEAATQPEVVPVIDLSRYDEPAGRNAISDRIRAACLSSGFFLITEHGVAKDILTVADAAMKRYFALPEEERMNDILDERFRRGFMPTAPGLRATVESYELSLDLPLDDPDVVDGQFLHGPNRWSDRNPWLREAIEPYLDAVLALGERLQRLFALSLDLPEEFFVELCRKPTFHLRLLHYFAQTEEEKKTHIATGAHSDFGMFTILRQDPNGGLQVQLLNGDWSDAPYVEDSFVINVGDMLELWTNGLYVSTPHRVIGLTGRDRYSIPAFFSPAARTLVECIPSCLRPGEAAKFKPVLVEEYIRTRLLAETKEHLADYQEAIGSGVVGGHRQLAS